MRICVECHHYVPIGALCARGKQQTGFDPVDGSPVHAYKVLDLAYKERKSFWPWRCGPDGRHFERSNTISTNTKK